jgi:hypothetical protein
VADFISIDEATTRQSFMRMQKALREFAPDIAKEMNKEINSILKPIAAEARAMIPNDSSILSGWRGNGEWGTRLKWNPTQVKKGIAPTRARSKSNWSGFTNVYGIIQKDAGGAVYEMAGRRYPNGRGQGKSRNPNAGRDFIRGINKNTNTNTPKSNSGRAIFPAVERNKDAAVKAIKLAISKASAKAEKRM